VIPMTREEYLSKLYETYARVAVLSDKEDSRVIRVRHRTLDRDMVVRSHPRPVAAYEVLYRLTCDNLPQIYDVVDLEDGQVVLEEYIDGLTVAQVMESGRYRPAGARRIVREVCRALTALHGQRLIHRDIKPENLLIDRNGRVVLIDFHAARPMAPPTGTTVALGTVGYASPEQYGLGANDGRTDLYAVGVLYNVLLTGKHPSHTLAKGRAGRVIRRCTQINPVERYPSAEKLEKAI